MFNSQSILVLGFDSASLDLVSEIIWFRLITKSEYIIYTWNAWLMVTTNTKIYGYGKIMCYGFD